MGALLFVGIAVYSIAQAVVALSRNNLLAAVVASSFAVFAFGLVVGIAIGKIRSPRLVGAVDKLGTTFRPDPLVYWSIGCSFLGGAVSAGLTLLFGGRYEVGLPFSLPGRESGKIFAPALFILCIVGLCAIVLRRNGYLRLSASHIEYADILQTRTASWSEVTAITDTAPRESIRHPISLELNDTEKPIVIGNASGYASNGAALYWMIRHYWLHPENRDELADGRALDRLRDEDFVAE